MNTPGPQISLGQTFRSMDTFSLESTLYNFNTASFTFLRLCLIFLGFVYVFFLRFLPPPASSRLRKTVDSSSRPHSPSTWVVASSDRPANDKHCWGVGTPQVAATHAFSPATSL